jgi:hypothetical protein
MILTLYISVVALCATRFKIKQDRQCTYNVTMRRVHESIVAVEKE